MDECSFPIWEEIKLEKSFQILWSIEVQIVCDIVARNWQVFVSEYPILVPLTSKINLERSPYVKLDYAKGT